MQDPKYQLHQKGQRIDELERRLKQGILQVLQTRKHGLNQAFTDLKHQSPQQIILSYQATLATLRQQLNEEVKNKMLKNEHLLALYFEKLDAVSPLSTFSRGYSLTQGESGKNIQSIQEIKRRPNHSHQTYRWGNPFKSAPKRAQRLGELNKLTKHFRTRFQAIAGMTKITCRTTSL